MPRQTFSVKDFSGGMNSNADANHLLKNNQIELADNCSFHEGGKIKWLDEDLGNNQAFVPDFFYEIYDADNNLDVRLGGYSQTVGFQLVIAVGDVGTPTDDLSWMDGTYNFKYTVCHDLGNGIIEEGPLQPFYGAGGTDIDMSGEAKGRFTFTHNGTTNPPFMDEDYQENICGRVYYSQVSGAGSTSQTGWIHLCDLILIDYDATDKIYPRPIDTTTLPTSNVIDIEEAPTASSFEMNAGYPSDVGIKSPQWYGQKQKVGMITYATAGFSYSPPSTRIYKSLPGQPNVWPNDNWVEVGMPVNRMIELGDFLCLWSQGDPAARSQDFMIYDVRGDVVAQTHKGLGLITFGGKTQLPAKCGRAVVWVVGDMHSHSQVYYFDGQLKEIGKARVRAVVTEDIQWYPSSGFIYFVTTNGNYHHLYSIKTDTWSYLGFADDQFILPAIDFGDPIRYKKIYSFSLHGTIGATNSGNPGEGGSIITKVCDENGTDISSKFTAGAYQHDQDDAHDREFGTITFTSNESVKVRALRLKLSWLSSSENFVGSNRVLENFAAFTEASFVFRPLNKFST